MTDTTEQIDEKLHTEINRFTAMWKSIAEKFHCPIIQNNFEMPLYRCLLYTSTAAFPNLTADQLGLKSGMLFSAVFPASILIGVLLLTRFHKSANKKPSPKADLSEE